MEDVVFDFQLLLPSFESAIIPDIYIIYLLIWAMLCKPEIWLCRKIQQPCSIQGR